METSANRLSRRQLLRRRTSALLAGAMGAVALSCVPDQPAGPADPKEPVQLRVLVPRVQDALVDPLPDWMEAAVMEVNATEPPSYRLTMHTLETRSAEWSQKVNELRSAGASSVDLLAVHLGDVPALQSSQALLSLESYRKRERSLDLNDYYRPVLAAHSWQDRLYALPFIASPLVMYYPPDLFAAANLLPPSADWRWDDLVVTAAALTRDLDGDGRTDQWGYLQLPGSPLSVQYIWQNGGAVLGPNGSVRLDEPAALEAVAFMAGLIQEARVSPSLRRGEPGSDGPTAATEPRGPVPVPSVSRHLLALPATQPEPGRATAPTAAGHHADDLRPVHRRRGGAPGRSVDRAPGAGSLPGAPRPDAATEVARRQLTADRTAADGW